MVVDCVFEESLLSGSLLSFVVSEVFLSLFRDEADVPEVVLIIDVSVTLEPLISVSMIATAEPSIKEVSIDSEVDPAGCLLHEVFHPASAVINIIDDIVSTVIIVTLFFIFLHLSSLLWLLYHSEISPVVAAATVTEDL